MSGGSYDYVFNHIAQIEIKGTQDNKRRALFQKLLKLVAKAMYDIEWVDSGDYGEGDENKAIDKVLNFLKGDPKTKWKALAYDDIAELIETNKEEL